MEFLTVYLVVQLAVYILLALATLYIFIFSFAGLFYKQPAYRQHTSFRKIAVLIPGYKEDDVIVEVASEALLQEYPIERYDVVIIADSFKPETIEALEKMRVKIIEVAFEKSTKAQALNKAMEQLPSVYDIAVVLDADNIMEKEFLKKINSIFETNIIAVQAHRTAKNMDTSLAVLDSVSEEINNHIFRKGHRVLGFSSAIIGSGMAFNYNFFKEMMVSMTAVGGFDKEIELHMLKNKHRIAYLDDAYVYDEKVQKSEVFSNQRRRWLSAQLHYFKKDFLPSFKSLFTSGNFDYFDKAIQFIQPPRILLMGAVFSSAVIFVILNLLINFSPIFNYIWFILIVILILSFIFSVPRSFYNASTLKALTALPKGMFLMLGSLLKIRGANKQFIHTKHTAVKNDKKHQSNHTSQ